MGTTVVTWISENADGDEAELRLLITAHVALLSGDQTDAIKESASIALSVSRR